MGFNLKRGTVLLGLMLASGCGNGGFLDVGDEQFAKGGGALPDGGKSDGGTGTGETSGSSNGTSGTSGREDGGGSSIGTNGTSGALDGGGSSSIGGTSGTVSSSNGTSGTSGREDGGGTVSSSNGTSGGEDGGNGVGAVGTTGGSGSGISGTSGTSGTSGREDGGSGNGGSIGSSTGGTSGGQDGGSTSGGTDGGTGCVLQATKDPLDFGKVEIGHADIVSDKIKNVGDQPCDLESESLNPGDAGAFSISTSPTLPQTLPPAQSVTVDIQFLPPTLGATAGTYQLFSSVGDVIVTLNGTGTAATDGGGVSDGG